jgi:hypothetical protein
MSCLRSYAKALVCDHSALVRYASKLFFYRPYLRQHAFLDQLTDLVPFVYSYRLATQLRLHSITYSDGPRAQLLRPPRPRLLLSPLSYIPP